MALKVDIREGDRWFKNTDFTVKFKVWEADGVTPRNVAGYALSWMLKKRKEDLDVNAILTKTTPTIAITGVFNISPSVNTQLVEVPIVKANTVALTAGVYLHELKRTDAGQATVLCPGSAILLGSVHKS